MSEIKLYKQKAIFVELPEPKTYGPKMSKKLAITYTRPDTETPNTPLTVGAFESELDETTKKYLVRGEKAILKPGDEICITKAQTGKFWTLISISDVSDAPVRAEKPVYNGATKTNNYNNTKGTNAYSPGGQTIGMAIKAAVDLTIANKGSIGDVADTARELLKLSATLDNEYNAGLFKAAKKAHEHTYTGPDYNQPPEAAATNEKHSGVKEVDELANLDFN